MAAATSRRISGLASAHFPEVRSFDQRFGGYTAFPWVFRSLLSVMNPRQWMLLSCFYLRSGPDGLSWETDQELANDLAIGCKKVGPHLRKLEELGFVVSKRIRRQRFVKLVDPMLVAERMLTPEGGLSAAQRARLAEDVQLIDLFRARSGRAVA